MLEPEKKEEQTVEVKKGSRTKKILFILIPIVVCQFGVAYVVINKYFSPKKVADKSSTAAKVSNPGNSKSKKTKEVGEIYQIKDIVVNPKETYGKRFISLSIGIEVPDSKTLKELEKRDIKIRDYVITLFTNLTIEQLVSPSDKDSLRSEILTNIDGMLPEHGVKAVYFSNFIIQ